MNSICKDCKKQIKFISFVRMSSGGRGDQSWPPDHKLTHWRKLSYNLHFSHDFLIHVLFWLLYCICVELLHIYKKTNYLHLQHFWKCLFLFFFKQDYMIMFLIDNKTKQNSSPKPVLQSVKLFFRIRSLAAQIPPGLSLSMCRP